LASDEARPGLTQGSRDVAETLFAALYGELTPRPDRVAGTDRDSYVQFHDRAQSMGWLDGLWGMNGAGRDHPLAVPGSSLVAWFQVGVESVPSGRSLPVQPFLRCAGDVTARLGALRLDAAQVLLPAHSLDVPARPQHARMPSLSTAAWFDDVRSAASVKVTVDSGQDPIIPLAAQRIHQWLNKLNQHVFRCESVTGLVPMSPPLPDTVWLGPPRHRVTFQGTLTEWSLDAIGWLGGFLADLAACEGAGVPPLLTVSRSTPSSIGCGGTQRQGPPGACDDPRRRRHGRPGYGDECRPVVRCEPEGRHGRVLGIANQDAFARDDTTLDTVVGTGIAVAASEPSGVGGGTGYRSCNLPGLRQHLSAFFRAQ
jgi:hypothetical protein